MGLVGVVALLVLTVGFASAATDVVTVPPSADAYLRSGAPDTNEGGSSFLRLRASGDNRALVRFDQAALEQAVGSGTLVSASLEVDITGNGNNWGSSGRTISAYRLTSVWAEGNGFVDSGSPPDRGSGSGATWACAVDADISDQGKDCTGATEWEMGKPNQPELHPWVEPATASVLITNGLSGTVAFDVTADVQLYLSGSAQSNGWILKKDLEGPSGQVQFSSSEAGNGPRLVIETEASNVDDLAPEVSAAGPLYESGVSSGSASLDVTVGAADDWGTGDPVSGVERIWLTDDSSTEVVSAQAPCAPACPAAFEQTLSVDIPSLSAGTHTFTPRAVDQAGNAAEDLSWDIVIDRTAPSPITDIRVASFDDTTQTATLRWNAATDPQLPDGSAGSGVGSYQYRYSLDGETWSDTAVSLLPELALGGVPLGQIVDVEVRAADTAGNLGEASTARVTVFEGGEPIAPLLSPEEDPDTDDGLTAGQVSDAYSIALTDEITASIMAGHSVNPIEAAPLYTGNGSLIGAHVTLALGAPATLEADWPLLNWNADTSTYTQRFVRFEAENVTSLDATVDFGLGRVIAVDVDVDAVVGPATIASGQFRRSSLQTAQSQGSGPEGNNIRRVAKNLRILTDRLVPELGSDVFFNWDFHSTRTAPDNVDWPVNLIWDEAADIHKAKDLWNKGEAKLTGLNRLWASPQYALLVDLAPTSRPGRLFDPSANPIFDSDRGVYKGKVCSASIDLPLIDPIEFNTHKWHYRVYVPESQDRMFNLSLSFYVIGTSHQDHNDNWKGVCPGDWYGGSERAEQEVAAAASEHPDWTVRRNEFNLRNRYPRQWVDNRLYENNGLATEITIACNCE